MYELFFGVDIADRGCDDGLFTATLTLESSEFADGSPTEIHILHWNFIDDVWTDIETIETAVDEAYAYQLDLGEWGNCDTQGSSIVFVPRSRNAYGDPRFITLERGAANGASSRYSFETDRNTVKFFCPQDQVDEAQATIYDFKKRQLKTSIALTRTMADDESLGGRADWVGTTRPLSPERDVVILLGKQAGILTCSFLL